MREVVVDIVLLISLRIAISVIISSFIICINCFRNKLLRNISGAVFIVLFTLLILLCGYRMKWELSLMAANVFSSISTTVIPYSPLIVFFISAASYLDSPKDSDERRKTLKIMKWSGIIAGVVIVLTVTVLCIFLPGSKNVY